MAKTCSMGLKRAIRRQVDKLGTDGFNRLADAADLVAGQIVHDHDVAGAKGSDELLLEGSRNTSPFIGPSTTKGAAMPLWRRPATRVVIFQ